MSLSPIIPLVCKAGSEGEVNDRVRRGVGAVIFSNSGASGCADAHPQIKMNLAADPTDSREQPQLTGQLFLCTVTKDREVCPTATNVTWLRKWQVVGGTCRSSAPGPGSTANCSVTLPQPPSLSRPWPPPVPNRRVGLTISLVPSNSGVRIIGLNTLTRDCFSQKSNTREKCIFRPFQSLVLVEFSCSWASLSNPISLR